MELDLDLVAVRQRLLVHAIRGFVALFTVFQLRSRPDMKIVNNKYDPYQMGATKEPALTPLTLDVS